MLSSMSEILIGDVTEDVPSEEAVFGVLADAGSAGSLGVVVRGAD